MTVFRFSQVDVFSSERHGGNPVAVVHDADGLGDQQMLAFARWTNLSETTFLLRPTVGEADYRLRIFTPGGELPFAGHPTLGSCHAWLQAGGEPLGSDQCVQECGAGLVRIRNQAQRLWFAAPPLRRTGPIEAEQLASLVEALGVAPGDVVDHQWIDNGPGWCGLLLPSADHVLALEPDFARLAGSVLGVVGPYPEDGDAQFEVRAFVPDMGVPEDPVTGSLNAGIAQWLIGNGRAPERYVASQGTRLKRRGRVHVESDGEAIWIGGDARTDITGEVVF